MDDMTNCFPDLSAIGRARMDAKFVKYAREKFPGISDDLINQNSCEIITAYDAEFKCKSCCMGLDMCPELINSAGYTYSMILQSNGWIKTEYVPCMFNGGRQFASEKAVDKFTQAEVFA